ncbi:MAG: DUF3592 domain-containing protein [Candidatus Heimdallarchaeota archaeon]|nr:DUF3592 domain-containing protein [Candidatus Heimdallarchaeota archaeon]
MYGILETFGERKIQSYGISIIVICTISIGFINVGTTQYKLGVQSTTWQEIEAIITKSRYFEDEVEDMVTYIVLIDYKFYVDDKIYWGDHFTPLMDYKEFWGEKAAIKMVKDNSEGENITIYYNQRNPDQNAMSTGVENKAKWKILFGIISMIINLVLGSLSATLYRRIQRNKYFIATKCKILDAYVKEEERTDDEGAKYMVYYPIIEYEYTIHGKKYRNDVIYASGVEKIFSQEVPARLKLEEITQRGETFVFYNPQDPEDAALQKPSFSRVSMLFYLFTGLLSIIPLIIWIFEDKDIITADNLLL